MCLLMLVERMLNVRERVAQSPSVMGKPMTGDCKKGVQSGFGKRVSCIEMASSLRGPGPGVDAFLAAMASRGVHHRLGAWDA